jgi:hypothetical protein
VRVAGASRAVSMAGSVNFALNDNTVLSVVAVDEEGQEHGDEKEDDVPVLD